MKITPKFYSELWKQTPLAVQTDAWPMVWMAWQEKNYLQCLLNLLDYINPEIKVKYKKPNLFEYDIPHGSSIVQLKINHDKLSIKCDLVNIENANKDLILKRVFDINHSVLKRAKIQLINHDLSVQYTLPIELCEPTKIYEVLKETCFAADHYDDLFVEKYNAALLTNPKINKLKSTDKILARNIALAILDETLYYIKYLETLHLTHEIAELLEMAIYRIEFTLSPQGLIKSKLEQTLTLLTSETVGVKEKIEVGYCLLQFLKVMPAFEFDKHLYQAEIFIPQKSIITSQELIKKLHHVNTQADYLFEEKRYIHTCLYYLHELYELLYRHYINIELRTTLVGLLKNTSEKSWELAAHDLKSNLDKLINNNLVLMYKLSPQ